MNSAQLFDRVAGTRAVGIRICCLSLLLFLWVEVFAVPAQAKPPAVLDVEGEALLLDLRKQIAIQEKKSWTVDRYEIEGMIPNALSSLCRVSDAIGPEVLAHVEDKIVTLGGPVESAYVARGRKLSRVNELLQWTRVAMLLREALRRAPKECPFWIKSGGFQGSIHRNTGRLSVNFEGGGLLGLRRQAGVTYFGGGGCSRLTLAYGVSESWSLRGGVEIGGSALLDESVEAEAANVDFFGAAPLVLRHLGVLWQQDIEVAPVFVGVPWKGSLQYGVRFGTLIGLSYLRVGNLIPWAGFVVTYEYLFERDTLPSMWTVRMGLRLGFDWSVLD
jgi:hypothetical protein